VKGLEARLRLQRGRFELDVTLQAPADGVTAVFGPSGSGKTTVLRCLAGLEPSVRGTVRFDGEPWQDTRSGRFLPAHRRPLAYVFQDAALFPHLTVEGNLRYALARRRDRSRPIDERRVIAWLGLESLIDRRAVELSGGEEQRVAVARALLSGPRLLLMDEPLANLDEASRSEILPYLDRLRAELEIPVLYVSHSRGEVMRFADRVVLLDAGRVKNSGPVDAVLTAESAGFGPPEEVGTVADGRVVDVDREYGLIDVEIRGGRLSLPADRELAPGARVRVRCLARDVSLTRQRPSRTSILNVLAGRVVEVRDARSTLPLVVVDVGGTILLARITRKSLVALELGPKVEVFAQVKSVALAP
jgi:molybdate transport system ATP-binding protein